MNQVKKNKGILLIYLLILLFGFALSFQVDAVNKRDGTSDIIILENA